MSKHRVTLSTEQLSYIVGALRSRLDELDEDAHDGMDEDDHDASVIRPLERRLTRIGSLVPRIGEKP